MPGKVTYGKRKNSILSLFPVRKDDGKPLHPPKTKAEKRVSATVSMSAFYGKHKNDSIQNIHSTVVDSIEEMTSMLLDDTTMNRLAREPRKCLSQLGSAKTLQPPQHVSSHDKALPQLPQLSFNSGNNWAGRSHHIAPATGRTSNEAGHFSDEEPDSYPPPVRRLPTHARKASAPPLPRKSSKRTYRQRGKNETNEPRYSRVDTRCQSETRKLTKMAQQNPQDQVKEVPHKSTAMTSSDVSQQVESPLMVLKTLRPVCDGLVMESPIVSKKNGTGGNGVLSKVKTAITERLHDKGLKRHQNSGGNEHLLDPDLSQLPDYDEEASMISAMELRISEGVNFENPKIEGLTGRSTVRRSPTAADEKSPLSPKSTEGLSHDCFHAAETSALASFDCQQESNGSTEQSDGFILSPPGRSLQHKEDIGAPSARKVESSFEIDFDALFSSSPIAQSTPRIRLEPTFEEDGTKRLGNVPADSRSMFGLDSSKHGHIPNVSADQTPIHNAQRKAVAKRNNSQVKDVGLGVRSYTKRRKKHPSPSKAELEGLEDALKHYSPCVVSMNASKQEDLTLSFGELQTGEKLKSKDNNKLLSQAAKRSKGDQFGIFGKPRQNAAGSSLAEPVRRPAVRAQKPSMIPKPAGAPTMKRHADSRMFLKRNQASESAMDTDELQWDLTAYHIGMRG